MLHASPCVDCSVFKRMPQACPLAHPSIACTEKLRQEVWSNHSAICDELELHEAVDCRIDLQSAASPGGSIPSALALFIHQSHPWIVNHGLLKIPAPFHHSFSMLRCSIALCPSPFRKAIILPSWDESRTTGHRTERLQMASAAVEPTSSELHPCFREPPLSLAIALFGPGILPSSHTSVVAVAFTPRRDFSP
mmetsp:Transcript_7279/g.25816  ORF Transcript_7279/g.25816 Transcript_7279/m.25816 type:complete len:193 (+) Transcript_7279:565-1143(+)